MGSIFMINSLMLPTPSYLIPIKKLSNVEENLWRKSYSKKKRWRERLMGGSGALEPNPEEHSNPFLKKPTVNACIISETSLLWTDPIFIFLECNYSKSCNYSLDCILEQGNVIFFFHIPMRYKFDISINRVMYFIFIVVVFLFFH